MGSNIMQYLNVFVVIILTHEGCMNKKEHLDSSHDATQRPSPSAATSDGLQKQDIWLSLKVLFKGLTDSSKSAESH